MRALPFAFVASLALALCLAGCEKRPRNRPLPPDAGLTGGKLLFEEDFEGDLAHWDARTDLWKIVDGRLYTGDKGGENKGIWLRDVTLPENVRMEFEVTSVKGNRKSFEGDLKFEFGGDEPGHAGGYIIIFGGWNNTINTIARHDEHGEGRLVVDSTRKVEEGKTYKFAVVRFQDEVKWFLDGELLLRVKDREPALGGAFGFNNWNSRVYYDTLRIYAL